MSPSPVACLSLLHSRAALPRPSLGSVTWIFAARHVLPLPPAPTAPPLHSYRRHVLLSSPLVPPPRPPTTPQNLTPITFSTRSPISNPYCSTRTASVTTAASQPASHFWSRSPRRSLPFLTRRVPIKPGPPTHLDSISSVLVRADDNCNGSRGFYLLSPFVSPHQAHNSTRQSKPPLHLP